MTATNCDQFEILVEFLEKNAGIAKNYLNTIQYRQTSNMLWNEVTERLNAAGPPGKSVDGWKKVWKDFKYSTKNKMRNNKKSITGTGGGPCRGEVQGINVSRFGCIVEPTDNPDTSTGNSITTHLDVELELIKLQEDFYKSSKRSDKDLIRVLKDTLKFNKEKWETKQIRFAVQKNIENDKYQAQQRVLVEQTKQKYDELELKRQELDLRERELEAQK